MNYEVVRVTLLHRAFDYFPITAQTPNILFLIQRALSWESIVSTTVLVLPYLIQQEYSIVFQHDVINTKRDNLYMIIRES